MEPRISIVVPIYKVEDYLDRCVQSLINQTYSAIEIILVDDGSPDSCPDFCDNFAKQDNRIKVIHKENGGLSDARNYGLNAAEGEYVLFVDSDDYIALDTCEKLFCCIYKAEDIVVGGANRVQDNKITQMKRNEKKPGCSIDAREYLKCELKTGTMFMPVWMNLYRRAFLLENNLFFIKGLLHEDEQWTPRVFLKAGQVVDSQYCFYYYIIRDGSITTGRNKVKNAEDIMQIGEELERIYSKVEDNELKRLLNDNLVNKFLNTFQDVGLHKKEYSYLVNKNFIKGKAFTKRNKLRVALFTFNKNIYYFVNKITKIVK